jgi:hypothetical protein
MEHARVQGLTRSLTQSKAIDIHCAYYLAGLVGFMAFGGDRYVCKVPVSGCLNRHVSEITEVTVNDVKKAVNRCIKLGSGIGNQIILKARHGGIREVVVLFCGAHRCVLGLAAQANMCQSLRGRLV